MLEKVALIMEPAQQLPFSVARQDERSSGLIDEEQQERRDRRIRIVLTLVLVTFFAFVIIDSFTNKYVEGWMVTFVAWVQENPSLGVLAVIIVYIFATGKLLGWSVRCGISRGSGRQEGSNVSFL
jgi:hypothetical protein